MKREFAKGKNISHVLHATRYTLHAILMSLFFLLFCVGVSEGKVPKVHQDCTLCHIKEDSGVLREGINEICIGCHPSSPVRDHPIGRVVKDVPERLPLDKENRITCVTCHEPHGKGTEINLLRMEFNSLCIVCHKM